MSTCCGVDVGVILQHIPVCVLPALSIHHNLPGATLFPSGHIPAAEEVVGEVSARSGKPTSPQCVWRKTKTPMQKGRLELRVTLGETVSVPDSPGEAFAHSHTHPGGISVS